VRPETFVGDRKTVDVHIRWLRAKFSGRAPFQIVTVRGLGYRLDHARPSPDLDPRGAEP
jgi:DNA-binding response OmpR family regulator